MCYAELMRFYLGAHMPHWLEREHGDEVPMFVSTRRLQRQQKMPRALHRWSLDSGGFTELSMFGEWRTSSDNYAAAIVCYRSEIGLMDWAAPQDWMCEPWILGKTGLTVAEHQARTIDSFLDLAGRGLPVVPVLQGWTMDDYLAHVDAYATRGVDLTAHDTVGLGSVCRRQATDEIARLIAQLSSGGLRLHGFGVKGDGLRKYGWALRSADSMAWSYRGRRIQPCPHRGVTSCANCWDHALEWRDRALTGTAAPIQMALC